MHVIDISMDDIHRKTALTALAKKYDIIWRVKLWYKNNLTNSDKFYTVLFQGDKTTKIQWGRVAAKPRTKDTTWSYGVTKIIEKVSKGYECQYKKEGLPGYAVDPNVFRNHIPSFLISMKGIYTIVNFNIDTIQVFDANGNVLLSFYRWV